MNPYQRAEAVGCNCPVLADGRECLRRRHPRLWDEEDPFSADEECGCRCHVEFESTGEDED